MNVLRRKENRREYSSHIHINCIILSKALTNMQSYNWLNQRQRRLAGRDLGPQRASKKYLQEGHSEASLPLPYSFPEKTRQDVVIN